jgi:hypothetical protein
VGISGFFDSYQIYLLIVVRKCPRRLYHDILTLGLVYLNLISKSLLPTALSQHNLSPRIGCCCGTKGLLWDCVSRVINNASLASDAQICPAID